MSDIGARGWAGATMIVCSLAVAAATQGDSALITSIVFLVGLVLCATDEGD